MMGLYIHNLTPIPDPISGFTVLHAHGKVSISVCNTAKIRPKDMARVYLHA